MRPDLPKAETLPCPTANETDWAKGEQQKNSTLGISTSPCKCLLLLLTTKEMKPNTRI